MYPMRGHISKEVRTGEPAEVVPVSGTYVTAGNNFTLTMTFSGDLLADSYDAGGWSGVFVWTGARVASITNVSVFALGPTLVVTGSKTATIPVDPTERVSYSGSDVLDSLERAIPTFTDFAVTKVEE